MTTTNGTDSFPFQAVHQTRHQGCLGADDDEIDRPVFGQGEQSVNVLGRHRDAIGNCSHSGIARGADQRCAEGGGADRPGQGMFAATATDKKNLHIESIPSLNPCFTLSNALVS